MPITTIRPYADCWADQDKPRSNNPNTPRLRLRATTTGKGKRSFLYFGLPFFPGVGARVQSAVLRLYAWGTWSGTHEITVRRVTEQWAENKVTWNNQPSVTNTNAATKSVAGLSDGDEIEIDIADMVADSAAGAVWFGVRLEVNTDTDFTRVYSSNESRARFRPVVEIDWRPALEAPTPLAPTGGQAVGIASPTLTWRNDWEEGAQAASQVQIASTEDGFGSPDYDSGEVANVEGQWDLTGEHTLTQGVPFYWRVRTKDDTGQWSEWSDVQEAVYEPRGTLTIISPPKIETRRNLCANPRAAAGTTGVTNGGLASIDAVEAPTLDGLPAGIATAYHCVATGSGQSIRFPIPVVSGRTYRFSFYFRAGAAGLYQLHAGNESGALRAERIINALAITIPDSVKAEPLGAFVRVDLGFVADSTGTWTLRANANVASEFWVAAVLAEETSALGPYFDGDGYVDDEGRWREDTTGEEVEWDGEPHASPSVRYDRFVEETTPPIVAELDGATPKQWAIELYRMPRAPRRAWGIEWSTGWHTSDTIAATVPRGIIRSGETYVVFVRARDDADRASTPGDSTEYLAIRFFRYQRPTGKGLEPVSNLTATPDGPKVTLTWTRTQTPDEWCIRVDGKEVVQGIDPEDVRVNANTYSMDLWLLRPGVEHEIEVEAVVAMADPVSLINVHSDGNDTATVTLDAKGVWLVDPDDGTAVRFVGENGGSLEMQIREVAETFDLVRSRRPVRITDALGGYTGSYSGAIVQRSGDIGADRDKFLDLKGRLKRLRLIVGDLNIPVRLEEVSTAPTAIPGHKMWEASFAFFQDGEFDAIMEVSGD